MKFYQIMSHCPGISDILKAVPPLLYLRRGTSQLFDPHCFIPNHLSETLN